jgi:hypothetical protein
MIGLWLTRSQVNKANICTDLRDHPLKEIATIAGMSELATSVYWTAVQMALSQLRLVQMSHCPMFQLTVVQDPGFLEPALPRWLFWTSLPSILSMINSGSYSILDFIRLFSIPKPRNASGLALCQVASP